LGGVVVDVRRAKILVASFVCATVATGATSGNMYLALAGIVIGALFMAMVRRRSGEVYIDERVEALGGRAARATFVIMSVFLGFLSLVFIFIGRQSGDGGLEELGTVFCYVVCLNCAVYSITFKYFDREHGGEN
jgi:uncharacterized membrane protein